MNETMIIAFRPSEEVLEIHETLEDREAGVTPVWTGTEVPGHICAGFKVITRRRAIGLIDRAAFYAWREQCT